MNVAVRSYHLCRTEIFNQLPKFICGVSSTLIGVFARVDSFSYVLHSADHISTQCAQQASFFLLHESDASGTFDSALRSFMPPANISYRRNQILEWFPFYVHRLIGDVRYRALKDYQQAWYLNLLFAAWVSERPGYLPDDGQLWRLANARTRQFFEKEFEPVMHMFEREGPTTDGAVWIYNRTLLEIYDEQVLKFHKRRRKSTKSTDDGITSYLDFEGTLKKENGREKCELHPHSGLTEWGTCYGCYEQKYSTDCG